MQQNLVIWSTPVKAACRCLRKRQAGAGRYHRMRGTKWRLPGEGSWGARGSALLRHASSACAAAAQNDARPPLARCGEPGCLCCPLLRPGPSPHPSQHHHHVNREALTQVHCTQKKNGRGQRHAHRRSRRCCPAWRRRRRHNNQLPEGAKCDSALGGPSLAPVVVLPAPLVVVIAPGGGGSEEEGAVRTLLSQLNPVCTLASSAAALSCYACPHAAPCAPHARPAHLSKSSRGRL